MKALRPRALAAVACLALLPAPAWAGWQSLGAMPPPQKQADGLVFASGGATLAVTALSPDVIRVRFSPNPAFRRDHSYALVSGPREAPRAVLDVGAGASTIATSSLRVTIRHDPLRISVANAAGEVIDEDDAEQGISWSGSAVRVAKRLQDDDHVHGLGEKVGRLDKRGWLLGGYTSVMWNTDTYGYDSSTDPLYVSVPFFMVLHDGKAHGVFLDNTFRSFFDVGHTSRSLLSFGAEGGDLDYYVINGPAPKQVVERYTELTGRMPMPPRWSLGYNQCRWSYTPDSRVRLLADTFREKHVPGDVIWLDIHYLDGYNPFTWDRTRFPDPRKLVQDLKAKGFHLVTIVDPHPKKQPGFPPYDSGLAGNHFVRNPDGSIFEGPVWPSNADRDPGPSVFPDFSRPATREWWGGLFRDLVDIGVAGIWNDMNEPTVFHTPSGTMPLDVRHDNEGSPTDHREIHNVYGMLMSRATFEGLSRLRPGERPFVLTRASFAGGQRYAAVWPGDNTSDWSHLRQSLPTLLGLGLSGFPFVGSDIGGFAGVPSAELFTRWIQLGVFYPFMRAHTELNTPDQEPWSFGSRHEELNRRAIELRYQLLPEIYNVMAEASATGLPAMRPLFLEYPEDAKAGTIDDEFLFGEDLLVAPVLKEAATDREIYLPKGEWFDYWTGRRFEGASTTKVPVTIESIPIFVRGGAFVFRQPVVQHTGQMTGQPLMVAVYPADRSDAHLYEDDGETTAYRDGTSLRRLFSQKRDSNRCVVEVGAPEGTYRPSSRDLVLQVAWEGEPRRVLAGGRPVPKGQGAPGWVAGDGFVSVRLADRWDAFSVVIER